MEYSWQIIGPHQSNAALGGPAVDLLRHQGAVPGVLIKHWCKKREAGLGWAVVSPSLERGHTPNIMFTQVMLT